MVRTDKAAFLQAMRGVAPSIRRRPRRGYARGCDRVRVRNLSTASAPITQRIFQPALTVPERAPKIFDVPIRRRYAPADAVLQVLADLFIERGPRDHIRPDNGPEFAAKAVRVWLGQVGVKTLFIEPGSPWENGYNESCNGKLRDELLDREIFCTLHEARVLIERWRRHDNTVRPHSALGYRPPAPQTILPPPAGPAYAPLRLAQPGAPWHGPPLS